MRNEFARGLIDLADQDDRVVLLTGDLGFTVLEPFMERHPDRFFNAGVAEQNMVGMATGLAEAGYVPFVYSIATFAALRPYEFIRNGPVLHELPVRIVGVGGGLDYGHNGVTHFALEDIAVMRAQPDLTVIAPADPDQAVAALSATRDLDGPAYFRLGREANSVAGLDGRFELGRAHVVREGSDAAIVTLGTMATQAVAAAELAAEEGISTAVVVVSCVAPAPVDDLVSALTGIPLVMTVEAHYPSGGVGSLVSEVVAENGLGCRVVRRCVHETPRGVTGTAQYLLERYGLDAQSLARALVETPQPSPS